MISGRTKALVGSLASAAVALAACGSSPTKAATKATTTTTTGATTTTVPGANLTPTFNPLRNAHQDVTPLGACTQNQAGTWVQKGTVVNPQSAKTGFEIVVDFVTQPGSTVLDTQIVQVPPVAPKKTVTWQASWTYSGEHVACVIRQSQTVSASA